MKRTPYTTFDRFCSRVLIDHSGYVLHRCLTVALVLSCNVAVAAEVRFPGRTVTEDSAVPLPAEKEAFYVFTDRALTRAQVRAAEDVGLRYLGIAGKKAYTFLRTTNAPEAAAWLRAQPNVLGTADAAPVDRVEHDLLAWIGPVESLPHPLWVAVYPKTTRRELTALLGADRLEGLRLPTDLDAPVAEESTINLGDNLLLERLMGSPFVASIGFDYPKKLHNLASRELSNAIDLVAAPYGLDGTGVVVGHWDGGRVDSDHPDFEGRVQNYEQGQVSSHATHTAGTILGGGVLNPEHRGYAPEATMVAFEFFGNPTGERRVAKHEFYHEHDNHSWGSSVNQFGGYNQVALEFDLDSRDLLLLPVKSAGNSGQQSEIVDERYGFDSLSPDSTAKNALVVGATQDDGDLSSFSSRGPTNDGRVKPDICANGQNLTSTYPGNQYGTTSGTSMSAPSVTGMLALLSQLYKRENNGRRWAPDMSRAIMIHTAVDVFHPGPDYRFGWGNADARAAADLIIADAADPGTRLARGAVRDKEQMIFGVDVPANAPNLKVTLSWLDAFFNSAEERRLLNDLDMELVAPDGQTFRPFVLDPENPFDDATTGVNNRDNVEQVVVDSPAAGTWGVVVSAASITDPDLFVQGFVLASDYPIQRSMERIDFIPTGQPLTIPDDDPAGLELPFDVQTNGEVRAVRLYIDVKHRARGHVRIELTSPTDQTVTLETEDTSTRRDIYGIYPDLRSYDDDTLVFTGEQAAGRWTARVIDVQSGEVGEVRQASFEVDLDPTTVGPPNMPPVANAGADQVVRSGATVQLDGSASSDPEGDTLTFAWRVAMGDVTLDASDSATPTFVAPTVEASTALVLRLSVDDGNGGTAIDDVTITVEPEDSPQLNEPPVANAGVDRSVGVGSMVVLDATGSTDPDGDPLTFRWTQLGGVTVALTNGEAAQASFTAPEVTESATFEFRVEVADGRGGMDIADVTIRVDPGVAPTDEIKTLETVNACGCSATKQTSGGWWALFFGAALLLRHRR